MKDTQPAGIDPAKLYPQSEAQAAAGLNKRQWETACRSGLGEHVRTFARRNYIMGSDLIAFLMSQPARQPRAKRPELATA